MTCIAAITGFYNDFFFAFIRIAQYVDRKWSGRERGTGSGKVCEPGSQGLASGVKGGDDYRGPQLRPA